MLALPYAAFAKDTARRANIVSMFADNVGVGEVGSYSGARGVRTPGLNRLAKEGLRLTDFNVEYSYVVSYIALMTGRPPPCATAPASTTSTRTPAPHLD